MGDLFYAIGLIVIILNLSILIRFKRYFNINEWISKFKFISNRNPNISDFRSEMDSHLLTYWYFTTIFTTFWLISGLLSKYYTVFTLIMLINIILNYLSRIFEKYKNIQFILLFLKSVIMISIVTFLVVNHFHLHIDLSKQLHH